MSHKSGFQLKRGGPELYEACWVVAQMGQCAVDLVAAAGVGPSETVLDVGCGTGVAAREAARQSGNDTLVTGADVNGPMLLAAQGFATDAGLHGIRWVECDAADMPFDDGVFDVVLCQQGIQFMPDKTAALVEMARVLKPGGRLAASVWKSVSPLGKAFSCVLDRHFGEGTTEPWQAVYSLGDREQVRTLAEGAGFEDIYIEFDVKFVRHRDPTAFVAGAIAGSPLADAVANMAEADRDRLVKEIIVEVGENRDDGGLAVPAGCHTLTARIP